MTITEQKNNCWQINRRTMDKLRKLCFWIVTKLLGTNTLYGVSTNRCSFFNKCTQGFLQELKRTANKKVQTTKKWRKNEQGAQGIIPEKFEQIRHQKGKPNQWHKSIRTKQQQSKVDTMNRNIKKIIKTRNKLSDQSSYLCLDPQ